MIRLTLLGALCAIFWVAPAAAAAAPAPGSQTSERVVCRRIAATGSIISRDRICRPESFFKRGRYRHRGDPPV